MDSSAEALRVAAKQRPEIGNIFTSFDPRYPQVKVELDREKARKLGVPVNEVFQALATSLGGSYVNDFNRFGRLFRVYVQAESDYRRTPEDIGKLWVRSKTTGDMIPLGTLVTISSQAGTELTNRFNLLRSVELNGTSGRGFASGQTPPRSKTCSSRRCPRRWGSPTLALLPGEDGAALRTDPRGRHRVRLPAPGRHVRELGGFLGGAARLASRDPRLLCRSLAPRLRQQRLRPDREHHAHRPGRQERHPIEFANAKKHEGMGIQRRPWSRRACARPILMTAFAFILGGAPDAASGAGAGSQNVMGTAVLRHARGHRPRRVPDPRQLRLRRAALGHKKQPASEAPPPQAAPAHGAAHRHDPTNRRRRPALLAGGCAPGPNYKRPAVPTPPTWREIPAAESQSLANTPWWEMFDDPTLQELVKIALVENKDLKIAVERIEEARARYGFVKADLWPKVDLSATGGGLRFNGGSLVHTPDADGTKEPVQTEIYSLSADMSWEIDFFGRIRRATEAQKALFLSTQEARRSAVLTLIADGARAYFELRIRSPADIARAIESRRALQLAKDRPRAASRLTRLPPGPGRAARVETVVFDPARTR